MILTKNELEALIVYCMKCNKTKCPSDCWVLKELTS